MCPSATASGLIMVNVIFPDIIFNFCFKEVQIYNNFLLHLLSEILFWEKIFFGTSFAT